MKLRNVLAFSVACLGLTACEEEEAPPEEAPPPAAEQPAAAPTPPPAPAAPAPGEVCAAIVEAAKANDVEKLKTLVTEASVATLTDEANGPGIIQFFAAATCGEAKVEGEMATVPVTAGEDAREAGFAKVADNWKLDAAGFATKYPPAKGKAKKGKKAKKAKKAKK